MREAIRIAQGHNGRRRTNLEGKARCALARAWRSRRSDRCDFWLDALRSAPNQRGRKKLRTVFCPILPAERFAAGSPIDVLPTLTPSQFFWS
jgi:hypothetical protein